MAARFGWTQLMNWEHQAVKSRVPQNVKGLYLKSQVPNNRFWWRRASSWERNGERTVLNHIWVIRFGFFIWFSCMTYQMWRPWIWGYTELMEHHHYNFDNIVYDKLSTRNIPYHYPVGMP